jgi:hypothetical protein
VSLLMALLLAASKSAQLSVGAVVVRSAEVTVRQEPQGVRVASRGARPGQVRIAPPDAAGDVVVTVLY